MLIFTKQSLSASPTIVFLLIAMSFSISGCLKLDINEQKLKREYANNESQFVKIDGMSVHYRDEGPSRAPCILLLHDVGTSLHVYDHWIDTLKLEYRVVSLDLPGFGLTGPHPNRDYSMKTYRDFLNKFMDELDIRACYAVGNGLGGRLAWELALAYPKRVMKMVLISPSGFPLKDQKKTAMEKMATGSGLQKFWFKKFASKKVVKKSVEQGYGKSERIKKEDLKRQYDLLRRKGNRQAFIDRVNQDDYDRTRRIKDIEVPVMIMWGADDNIIPIEHASYFHKLLPNSKLKLYSEVGHFIPEEIQSQAVLDIMIFLNYRK